MKSFRTYLLIVLALPAIFTLCACSSFQMSPDETGMSEADYQTAMVVYERLGNDNITSQYNFHVTANSGVVTLSGWVDNPQARSRAVSIAKGALSVQAVVDRMSR